MIGKHFTARRPLFWLVFVLWLATALPIATLSLFMWEIPLWPSFSAESTSEGVAVWAVVAAWFYVTPVGLILVSRTNRRPSA
jgi:uncharacterized membrane protein YhaH (DUF805 family)